jgi:hypothetical protein
MIGQRTGMLYGIAGMMPNEETIEDVEFQFMISEIGEPSRLVPTVW